MVFVKLAHILFGYECLKKTFNNISHLPQMQSDAHILTENPVYHASCNGRGNLKVHLQDMIFHSINISF